MKAVINAIEENEYSIKESFNSLKTNLQFSGKDIQTILFTSSIPNEGKSFVTFNLARMLAQDGKKIILLDMDLRKSVFVGKHKVQIPVEAKGMSHYLSGQATMEEIICNTNIDNLDMVFTGPVVPNPTALLSNDYLVKLLTELKKTYDFIILDTPPIGTVIDAAVIAPLCDGAVMVVGSTMISRKYALESKKQLEKTECKVLGIVLNKIDRTDSSYYGKHYKYKYYEYYKK